MVQKDCIEGNARQFRIIVTNLLAKRRLEVCKTNLKSPSDFHVLMLRRKNGFIFDNPNNQKHWIIITGQPIFSKS